MTLSFLGVRPASGRPFAPYTNGPPARSTAPGEDPVKDQFMTRADSGSARQASSILEQLLPAGRVLGAMRRYAAVWRIPGAPLLLVGGVFARLGMGMTPLALLFLVHQETGEYTLAAVTSGAYALSAALASPVVGRLVDRLGPPRC